MDVQEEQLIHLLRNKLDIMKNFDLNLNLQTLIIWQILGAALLIYLTYLIIRFLRVNSKARKD